MLPSIESHQKKYIEPPLKTNETGEPRRVGFELEFAGLEMAEVANILADSLSGTVKPKTHAECELHVPELGQFVVELDWHYAKETALERAQQHAEASDLKVADDPFMEWLTKVASQVVPVEVVCPPITIANLHQLDNAVAKLGLAGALGTEESLIYAFGVHINPELPDTSAATIISYLKAYCVSQSWLLKAHNVDPVRRIAPYIDLYPKDYLIQVLSYRGDETIEQVIDDYLALNPTRNRALDMTPLFKHIDESRLTKALSDPRINSRPTFHYRMPNCSIENPNWNLRKSWSIWCVIEQLASDSGLLDSLSAQCKTHLEKLITFEEEEWHSELESIHKNLESG